MKSLIVFGLLCFLAVSVNSQVFCQNPGSLDIPVGPCCNQIPGRGLGGAVNGMLDLMDLECMVNMYFDRIITYPEMTEFHEYITGEPFEQLILNVHSMPEFDEFMRYLCNELNFDFYLYLNTLADILGHPRFPHPDGPRCHPNFPIPWINSTQVGTEKHNKNNSPISTAATNGVRKFFDDLNDEIPSDKIYNEWLWKIDNDDYLCDGFLKLSHPNFVAVADAVERDPAFIEFKNALIQWDVPMDQWIEDLKQFLWFSNYCR